MCSFAEVTRPEICKDAVGGWAACEEGPDADAIAFDASAWGAEAEEKSTRETWTVRFRRTRCDSVEPVDDTFCTRLGRTL